MEKLLNTEEMEQIPAHLRGKVQKLQDSADLADKWERAYETSNQIVKEVTIEGIRWFTKQPTGVKIGLGVLALGALFGKK